MKNHWTNIDYGLNGYCRVFKQNLNALKRTTRHDNTHNYIHTQLFVERCIWTRYQSQCASAHVPTFNKSIDVFQPNESRRYSVYWIDERRNTSQPVSNQADRERMMIHPWNGKIYIREEYRRKTRIFVNSRLLRVFWFFWTDSIFRLISL